MNIHGQRKHGRINLSGSRSEHCSCILKSTGRWRRTGSNLSSSKIESSSCRCITTSIGENMKKETCILNSSEVAAYAKKPKDIGHSSEKCGTERTLTSKMVRGTMFSRGAETVASIGKLVDACQHERSHLHDSRKQVIAFAHTCFVLIVGVDDRMGTKNHSEVVGVLCLRTHIEACGGHA